ncbi:MAG TPA: NAD(P)/FAD-dependent oxidoreductase [Streptosporangiaceae bacterium]|nr:NAD(P)/FAD-dependent oxidoreductase [Streptosporangiaceae bacterium]
MVIGPRHSSSDDAPDLPVIVVGAGPVGMTAAARLARDGLPVIVVEAEPTPKTDWRASTFHAATLELLEDIGVTPRMHAEGLVVPIYHFRDRRDGLIAVFDFGLLADETRYPYRLQLNQQHLVRMLHERLRAADGVELLFGSRVTDVATTADGVRATVRTPRGERTLRGSHLIGADGAASTVRQALGIEFPGHTYPERFVIVSTSVDLRTVLPGIADVNYVADPEQWLFILHTPESWRVLYPVPSGESPAAATDPRRLQEQLQAVAPLPSGYPIVDQQIYNVHQRVAATFRVGNIVIAGDAAHINSPIGGVGLNSGIHDVMDVAARIRRIRAGETDPEAELTAYDSVRRRIAVDYVQADTHRNTERLKETDAARRRASRDEMRATAADPARARAYLRRVSLLESVRRFGIGLPPEDLTAHAAATPRP